MSGGYAYGDHEPVEPCPYCATPCRADFVDVGIGFTQCGPYHCAACGASEIGPYDTDRPLTEQEKSSGWYAPDSEPGSSANVIGGRIVSHVQVRSVYVGRFTGSHDWQDKELVDNWWKELRE